ncbi:methionyl-tRNA formyltransferase [Bacillus benzoevorans]|uniref:Methionyl-tRNA formyltransferase n=1 Tax=Bacillus benzoevorans TaxID=1456 RepID=A0A7X0LUP7_9BACI|nr:methionyl-tRNA formyltransferase [Bacillus benzoevorans]MBB6443787.1 methionyl-tRNA formyltransferase [Bacillus benzoevorans]
MTRVIFMGTPDFSVPILRQMIQDGYEVIAVVTQPDRPVGRKKILTPPPVKVEAIKLGIPVYQPEKISRAEELAPILELNPELVVTAAFGQILPRQLLEAPRFGCINVHASLLPDLRGGAPIHYSIIQGKEKTGVTIMYMAEKLDAGDMLTQIEVPILENDNVGTLHDKLSAAGAKLLAETIPPLLEGRLSPIPQVEEQATYAPNIKREQEKIDWAQDGETLYNQIRGLNPWPVAYTTFNGNVMKIWQAVKADIGTSSEPGTIIKIEPDGFTVATGNKTALKVIELQPSGKKKMTAEQYLRGSGSEIETGMVLGD